MNEQELKTIHLALTVMIREYSQELKKPLSRDDAYLLEERIIEAKVLKCKVAGQLGWS